MLFIILGDGSLSITSPASPLPIESGVRQPTHSLTELACTSARVDSACPEPIDSARLDSTIFLIHSVILLKRQLFFSFAQSFCYHVSQFATINSYILLQLTQLFCYSELIHFCYIAHSFYAFIRHFVIVNSSI
jgi:hypothetical protein